jgi:hypothetical protein
MMAFENMTEREIAFRLVYRADQLTRMLGLEGGCPKIILDQQRAMIREAALALPAGSLLLGEPFDPDLHVGWAAPEDPCVDTCPECGAAVRDKMSGMECSENCGWWSCL